MNSIDWKTMPPADGFVRPADAAKQLALGLSTFYFLAKQGLVPAPVKIVPNGRASGVPKNQLEAFIASRAATKS